MKKSIAALAFVCLFVPAFAAYAKKPFPTLDQQLKKAHVKKGSALEKLIKDHQDFSKLKDKDADDEIVPPWLKVYWRKGHPEADYDNDNDPTGGYPHVLKEVLEWMITHQDFQPGLSEASKAPGREFGDTDTDPDAKFVPMMRSLIGNGATPGTNVRTSGAQTVSRSESDIRINYWNPSKIIVASNNIGGSGTQGMYYSSDGGVTWGQTNLPLASGDAYHSDPTVDWSSDGTAWSTTMGINGNVLKVQSYRSTNGGATWTFDGTISGSQTNTDKQMQWIDHSATSPYANNNYVIWHNGLPAYMNRRTSSGWGTPIQVSSTETTGTAIGSDVKTNSSGDVFGFWPDTGSRGIYVVKSTNGGTSYSAPVRIVTTYDSYDIGVPSFNNRRALIYVSGGTYRNGATNNVYALWTDLSGDTGCTTASNEPGSNTASSCKTRIWFSRSTDGGATWSARVKINNQAGLNDQFNPFLAIDETTGTLGAMYYDTVSDAGRKKVDVWYQMSTDGGATWSAAVKVTTSMTDETISGTDFGNQFGDYNSLSGYANVFFPSWTDRRNNAREEIWTAKIITTTAPTFSISGSAGTSGANVTAGSSFATSDGSNNYSIPGLVAGTYTVTPTKSGCTFSPTSSSVTITSANVTGVNFTATCSASTYSISGNTGTSSTTVTIGASSTTSDASGNYAMSGFAAGTYTVTPIKSGCVFSPASSSVTITSANATANFTASCGDTQLTSGIPVTGQSVALGTWKYYYITVPAGATNLTFTTTNAANDVDIYTQYSIKPTLSSYICRPYTTLGNETCSAPNPAPGLWWVGVYGFEAGSFTITGTVTVLPPTIFTDGFEQLQTLPGRWSGKAPAGAASNTVAVTNAARLGPTGGLWGLQVTLQDIAPRNQTYVYASPSQGFSNETMLRGSFFIDPQGINITGLNSFQMIDFLDTTGAGGHVHLIFLLQQDPATLNYHLNAWYWNQTLNSGAGNWAFAGGSFFALKNAAWHNNRIDFIWNNGNPGHLTMWRTLYTNGAPDPSGTIQMFSNDLPGMSGAVINYVFAGMFSSQDSGTSGVLYLDEFTFSR